ncbi:MAG TPA: tRNA (adenosine(37)-N6)-dimethylallyltransferase MiaA [Candidatus Methylomirabilis sp.]|nr:tRNA (adenosine(37)-N6)-dimethylallyltransferase MiaA [Candidatus Methylomirabilis sp.]
MPIIIAGPTAVGKSALAIQVARRARGEIIVADSMQVYRGLDIGTGKPSRAEREAVPHHLLDICDPAEVFSASEFAARAHALVDEIRARGSVPVLVGGTGLYLRAFLKGRLAGPAGDPAIRARLLHEVETIGLAALHERLRREDPATAERVHAGDRFRIIRALELREMTGQRPSEIRSGLWDPPRVAVAAVLVLTREREELHALIDARARRMWAGGLVEEVRGLLRSGYDPSLRALQSLGYRQALAVLQDGLSEADALRDMQRATRNYAKRQLTWFRREPAAEWVSVSGWHWVEPLAETLCARLAAREAEGGPAVVRAAG